MTEDFDLAAASYDVDFTHSNIGMMQRQQVWEHLDIVLYRSSPIKILELNCGTGEDALRLAKQGHHVTASDISEEMLQVAKAKDIENKIQFTRIDLNKFHEYNLGGNFDLIYSNFGGLNCIDSSALSRLSKALSQELAPNGRFIGVIMPKFCFWETFYFLLKRNSKEAFRRGKAYALAHVSGNYVKTWYYSPKSFSAHMSNEFKKEKLQPIGLFVPPSYLESFFSKRLGILKFLYSLEKALARFSWQAAIADHYFIQLRLK